MPPTITLEQAKGFRLFIDESSSERAGQRKYRSRESEPSPPLVPTTFSVSRELERTNENGYNYSSLRSQVFPDVLRGMDFLLHPPRLNKAQRSLKRSEASWACTVSFRPTSRALMSK